VQDSDAWQNLLGHCPSQLAVAQGQNWLPPHAAQELSAVPSATAAASASAASNKQAM
jgi:hypothetical protein